MKHATLFSGPLQAEKLRVFCREWTSSPMASQRGQGLWNWKHGDERTKRTAVNTITGGGARWVLDVERTKRRILTTVRKQMFCVCSEVANLTLQLTTTVDTLSYCITMTMTDRWVA